MTAREQLQEALQRIADEEHPSCPLATVCLRESSGELADAYRFKLRPSVPSGPSAREGSLR